MKGRASIQQQGIFLRTISIMLFISFMLILIFFYCYQWFLLPKYEKGILSEAELSCKMIGSNMENSVIRTISQLVH